MRCLCGAEMNQTGDQLYTTTTVNQHGEIVFAVCTHGEVVINKENRANSDYQRGYAAGYSAGYAARDKLCLASCGDGGKPVDRDKV